MIVGVLLASLPCDCGLEQRSRLPVKTIGATDTTRLIRVPRRAAMPIGAARARRSARNSAPIRAMPTTPSARAGAARNQPGTQAAAVLETAAACTIRTTRRCSAPTACTADAGNLKQALDVLERAHSPDQPDWRILLVQGRCSTDGPPRRTRSANYASGAKDHAGGAFGAVQSWAFLCTLEGPETRRGNPRRASAAQRRQARAAEPRQVVASRAFRRAEGIARSDLPPSEASANVAYLRQMLAQKGSGNLKKSIRSRTVEGLEPVEEGGS